MGWFRSASRPLQVGIGCGVLVAVCACSIVGLAAIQAASNNGSNPTGQTATSTSTPGPTATPHVVHYPPTTNADLLGLAAKGDASAIRVVHSDSVGLVGVCPQPRREVIVDPKLQGQQFAEDLLAYFYSEQLTNPCGSVVFAYHTQSEVGDIYSAGRVLFDVCDSNGQANIDPNATNLKYTLTLDVGSALSPQEYVVTY